MLCMLIFCFVFFQLFRDPAVHDLLVSFLHTAQHHASVFKNNSMSSASTSSDKSPEPVPVVAAKVLWTVHQHDSVWPLTFLKAYLDDVLECRVWVDSADPLVKHFVNNLTAWMSAEPVKFRSDNEGTILAVEGGIGRGTQEREDQGQDQDQDEEGEEDVDVVLLDEGGDRPCVEDRFRQPGQHQSALSLVLAATRAKVNAKGGGLGAVLRAVRVLCVLPCVRLLATQCLPLWLGNPALVSSGRETVT